MRKLKLVFVLINLVSVMACAQKTHPTNGETIYKTGRNLKGEKIKDKKESRIPFINNCQFCHGINGDAMKGVSIRFKDLSNPGYYDVPYDEELFFRFLDKDLKSDGSKANIGIIWKMSADDKKDLLAYLKSL